MAGGREYSNYQRKLINRYYNHKDSILVVRLQELASELYLAEGKEADRLWVRAEKALAGLNTDPPLPADTVRTILETKDPAKLAELMTTLATR
ncbi:MAG: hypothetical protein AAF297_07730 [Planctomycetota bacterium]